MKLSERIKALRKSKNLTQTALAELLEVHSSTISQLESGKVSMMSADIAIKMAKILDTTVQYLINGDLDNTKNSFEEVQNIDTKDSVDYKEKYIRTLEEKTQLAETIAQIAQEKAELVKMLLDKEREDNKAAQEKVEKL